MPTRFKPQARFFSNASRIFGVAFSAFLLTSWPTGFHDARYFFLLALSALFLLFKFRFATLISHSLALIAFEIGYLSINGFLYHATIMSTGGFTWLAFHSAFALCLLSTCLLTVRPQESFMAIFLGDNLGSVLARRLLPIAVILPIVTGWTRFAFEQLSPYPQSEVNAFYVIFMAAFYVFAIWASARLLNRLDRARKKAQDELRKTLVDLETRIQNRTQDLTKVNNELTKITIQQKRSEMALKQSESFLADMLSNLPVALFCKDVKNDFRFTLWNKMSEEVFGLSAQTAIGKNDYDFFPKAQADYFRATDKKILEERQVVDIPVETVLSKNQGDIFLHTIKVPLYDLNGQPNYLLGISEDITAKKLTEEALKQSQMRNIESSRLSALGVMAGGIAHEINNPLSVIGLNATLIKELLKDEEVNKAKAIQSAENIEQTVHRIARIIKGLRTFARDTRSDPFEEVSLKTIVDDTLAFCLERFKERGIEVRLNIGNEAILLECRAAQISQVLLNLLNNAFDAIENLNDKWIQIDVIEEIDLITLSITDSGLGIKKEDQEKMMLPFFTTKPVGKGTGLGLGISKGIVESHRGTLRFDASSINTRFVVTLPKKQPVDNSKTQAFG